MTQHEVRYTITTSTYLGYYQTVIILEIVKLHMKNKQCPSGDKTKEVGKHHLLNGVNHLKTRVSTYS